MQAISLGKWKLYLPHQYRTMDGKPGGTGGIPERYSGLKLAETELYNLADDLSEKKNVASENPEKVKELLAIAEEVRVELGDMLTSKTASGKGSRPPGMISDEEVAELMKIHWPNGKPQRKKK